jgi:hypothetical protein
MIVLQTQKKKWMRKILWISQAADGTSRRKNLKRMFLEKVLKATC